MAKSHKLLYQYTDTPYLPAKIRLDELKSNGKLFSEAEIKQIEERLTDLPNGLRLSRKQVREKCGLENKDECGIIKLNGEFYALKRDPIGRGGWGKAYAAQHLKSGAFVVVKDQVEVKGAVGLTTENEILKLLNQSLGEVFVRRRERKPGIAKEHGLQQYARGQQLHEFLYLSGINLLPTRLLDICIKSAEAVRMFHEKTSRLHRDISTANIIVDIARNSVKLIDFGLATRVGHRDIYLGGKRNDWMPPEMDDPDKQHDPIDIYELGYLFKMILGYKFTQQNQVMQRITILSKKNNGLESLTDRMMSADPVLRPTFDEVLKALSLVRMEIESLITNKTAAISIQELKNASPEMKAEVFRKLEQEKIVQIVLINKSSEKVDYDKDLIAIMREIESKGFIIKDKILVNPGLADLRNYFDEAQEIDKEPILVTQFGISTVGIQSRTIYTSIPGPVQLLESRLLVPFEREAILLATKTDDASINQLRITRDGIQAIKNSLADLKTHVYNPETISNKIDQLMTSLIDSNSVRAPDIRKIQGKLHEYIANANNEILQFENPAFLLQHNLLQLLDYLNQKKEITPLEQASLEKLKTVSHQFNDLIDYYQQNKYTKYQTAVHQFGNISRVFELVVNDLLVKESQAPTPSSMDTIKHLQAALLTSAESEEFKRSLLIPEKRALLTFERSVTPEKFTESISSVSTTGMFTKTHSPAKSDSSPVVHKPGKSKS